jgi:plastocyanin
VEDDYFTPLKMTVRRGTRVTWKWPGFENSGDVHDVYLAKRPTGVKRFHSESASSDYSFRRTLRVRGTYKYVCTFHADMRGTIVVK